MTKKAAVSFGNTVLQSKRGNFVVFLLYSRKCTRRVYFEFMGGYNKHLYSFVGSHMLSHDLSVPLWLHFVN